MKTKENNSENRKQNAKRALLKITTVMVSFVLISLTVNAQKNLKYSSSSAGTEIFAMLESNHTNVGTVSSNTTSKMTLYIEPAVEETLELETWMTDEIYFNAFSFILETAIENSLELEEWMMNESYFTNPCEVETEEELKLESWMMDEKIWK